MMVEPAERTRARMAGEEAFWRKFLHGSGRPALKAGSWIRLATSFMLERDEMARCPPLLVARLIPTVP